MTTTATHFVFVDFENVPEADLSGIRDQPVYVTLLLGKNQNKISVDLALQIQTFATQVNVVRLNASGRNALDFTLACYLGRAIEHAPTAQFAVVSKDKDFEPMISHLDATGVKIVRVDSFAAVPFVRHRKPAANPRTAVAVKAAQPAKKTVADPRTKVINRLKNPSSRNRPCDEAALHAHIKSSLGKNGSDAMADEIIRQLVSDQHVAISPTGKVSYPSGP